ncbi:MAG: DUF1553 domain-containing protein [Zavarzinella sp.]
MLCSPLRHNLFLISFVLATVVGSAAEPSGKDLAFFEEKIRPVLVEHCYRCHSAVAQATNKLRGGLLLDSKSGWEKGGDSGVVIHPGQPEKSLLFISLNYEDDVQMPPKGKLPKEVIANFEAWIKLGAPDPRISTTTTSKQVGLTIAEGRKFWSYQSVKQSPAPVVSDENWNQSEIDRFVWSKLSQNNLKPAKRANDLELLRRVYFDLTGLPPSVEAIEQYTTSQDPKKYEKLIDQLIASRSFGERWGRHWLDIVRYADSVTLRGLVFQEAWRYRDFVIDSFNQDIPFNRMILEQIAGDLLPAASLQEKHRLLTAVTMLQMGNSNLENQDKNLLRLDVVDEQLDVITKGFLAQTVTCARCHDHKFDPIPTADYYALAGILRNSKALVNSNVSKWMEVPLPLPANMQEDAKRIEVRIAQINASLKALTAKSSKKTVNRIIPLNQIDAIVVDDSAAKKVGDWQQSVHSGSYINTGYLHDMNADKGSKTLTFEPVSLPPGEYEVLLAYSHGESRSKAVPVTVFSADGEKTTKINMQPLPAIEGRFVSLGKYRFEKDGQAYVMITTEATSGHVTADAVIFAAVNRKTTLLKSVDQGKTTPDNVQNEVAKLQQELKQLQTTLPKQEMVMAVIEESKIEDMPIHIRGNPSSLGSIVPRGFLSVITDKPARLPKDQSGRKELAEWIADDNNPLTARVMVNRVWHWLMGSGIVRTTDNFGTTGEKPSHPEMLDYLATEFVRSGWSVKKIVRKIVLSQTYQQSVTAEENTIKADPDNRFFGRMNHRRLEAECIRDAILAVSGQLQETHGGKHFPDSLNSDYTFVTKATIRSVYLPYFRNALPEIISVFDPADTNMVTGNRTSSTVAPQALFMMNSPFVQEQATYAAAQLRKLPLKTEQELINRAYLSVYGRKPSQKETLLISNYLLSSDDPQTAWTGVFHTLFSSAEFRFVK